MMQPKTEEEVPMAETGQLPADWKDQLKTADDKERRELATQRIAQIQNMPVDQKAPFTAYLPVKHIEILKVLAEVFGTGPQDMMREGVEMVLAKYTEKPRRKKRGTTKRAN